MPIREIDRRRQEVAQLKQQLATWDQHLRDRDWIERIKGNADWLKLCELFKAEIAIATAPLADMKTKLCQMPMAPDQRVFLAEQVMLMERDLENCRNLLCFPEAEVARLVEIQREYPKLQERLKELEVLDQKEETINA